MKINNTTEALDNLESEPQSEQEEKFVIQPSMQIVIPRHNYFYFSQEIEVTRGYKYRSYGFIVAFACVTISETQSIEIIPISDLADKVDLSNYGRIIEPQMMYSDRCRMLDMYYLKKAVYANILLGSTKMRALQEVKRDFLEHDIMLTPRVKEIFAQVDIDEENPKRIKIS